MAQAHSSDAAIREQAYYLWEQDGRPHGREMEYWRRATVSVAEESHLKTLSKGPPKKAVKLKAEAADLKAGKVKAVPAKSAKSDSKAKPKKK